MLSMKKKTVFVCFAALALLLAFSACSGGGSTPPPKATITITNAPTGPYYSLTVFEANAQIETVPQQGFDTGLRGHIAQTVGYSTNFSFSEFPPGDYVLVLGASPDMGGPNTQGKFYITGTPGTPPTRKTVSVNFSDPINFSEEFISTGYTISEITNFNDGP